MQRGWNGIWQTDRVVSSIPSYTPPFDKIAKRLRPGPTHMKIFYRFSRKYGFPRRIYVDLDFLHLFHVTFFLHYNDGVVKPLGYWPLLIYLTLHIIPLPAWLYPFGTLNKLLIYPGDFRHSIRERKKQTNYGKDEWLIITSAAKLDLDRAIVQIGLWIFPERKRNFTRQRNRRVTEDRRYIYFRANTKVLGALVSGYSTWKHSFKLPISHQA